MKLIGLLSWYDERPDWLAAAVASLAKADVSHLVAVDGPYALFPDHRAASPGIQHDAIRETASAASMGLTLHVPSEPWAGNEVEKRSFCFELAETVAEPFEDWYLVCDADQFIVSAIGHTARLATDCDVAETRMIERHLTGSGGMPFRNMFRALPGLRLDGNHYTYRADGRNLSNGSAPVLDLSCIEIEHRLRPVTEPRRRAQLDYYQRRDREQVEA